MGMNNLLNLHPMEYQAQSPEQLNVMKNLNLPLKELYDKVDEILPNSSDKTVTLRKFQELRMQLNLTIVLNGVNK